MSEMMTFRVSEIPKVQDVKSTFSFLADGRDLTLGPAWIITLVSRHEACRGPLTEQSATRRGPDSTCQLLFVYPITAQFYSPGTWVIVLDGSLSW